MKVIRSLQAERAIMHLIGERAQHDIASAADLHQYVEQTIAAIGDFPYWAPIRGSHGERHKILTKINAIVIYHIVEERQTVEILDVRSTRRHPKGRHGGGPYG